MTSHEEDTVFGGVLTSVAIISVLLLALALGGCRLPPTGTVGGRVVDCTTATVKGQWPRVVGPVNSCLSRPDGENWRGCLDLLTTSLGVAVDVVACVVRGQGEAFRDASNANPMDVRSARAGWRAEEYARGFTFAE
jgi:hypothetical protein